MAQKALIIQAASTQSLDEKALNKELAAGWRLLSACPFGVGLSAGGQSKGKEMMAAILVILEKP